jgi:hypothetical protein
MIYRHTLEEPLEAETKDIMTHYKHFPSKTFQIRSLLQFFSPAVMLAMIVVVTCLIFASVFAFKLIIVSGLLCRRVPIPMAPWPTASSLISPSMAGNFQ